MIQRLSILTQGIVFKTTILALSIVFLSLFVCTPVMSFQKSSESLQFNENGKKVLDCMKKLAEKSDPSEFIDEILNWSITKPKPTCTAGIPSDGLVNHVNQHLADDIYPHFFTGELRTVYLIERKCTIKTREVCCGGDFNPILHAQDIPDVWVISKRQRIGNNYQVDVHFQDTSHTPVRIFLTKKMDGWKIEDACRYENGNPVVCTLSSLKACKKENLQSTHDSTPKGQ